MEEAPLSERPRTEREQQAHEEIGITAVHPAVAWVLSLALLALCSGVLVAELVRAPERPGDLLRLGRAAARTARAEGPVVANRSLVAGLRAFEDRLDEESLVAEAALPGAQWVQTALLGVGNEQVYVASRDHQGHPWLYYRPAVDSLTGPPFLDPGALARRVDGAPAHLEPPQPDPRPSIRAFAAELRQRGIELVLFPVPVKASVVPGPLAGRRAEPGIRNPSTEPLFDELRREGIAVFDPLPALLVAQAAPGADPTFLATDTHWSPRGMRVAALGLADFLRQQELFESAGDFFAGGEGTGGAEDAGLATRELGGAEHGGELGPWIEGRGDLYALLRLPTAAGAKLFPPQRVKIFPVRTRLGEPWRAQAGAPLLLLGDSFTNVFSQPALGWGEGAGLAETLSQALGVPVDRIAVNAGGPAAARERLAEALALDSGRLEPTRVVVWQFSERELTAGDWRIVPLIATSNVPSSVPDNLPGTSRNGLSPEVSTTSREVSGTSPDSTTVAGFVEAELGRGFGVWESNRLASGAAGRGDWRIGTRRLDGSGLRQLSPDEPGRQHCCASISPDGRSVVYLSRQNGKDSYPKEEVPGSLRRIALDGSGEETLAPEARTYGWGNRAVVWKSPTELIFVGGDGRTLLLDLGSRTGRGYATRPLTREPRAELGWLLDPTLTHATSAAPSFSLYDREAGRVIERSPLPGCEPTFSPDGRWGLWVSGGGGPVERMALPVRRKSVLLAKNDPRLPGDQGYLYFPSLSRDGRAFAFGASAGEHDHFRANYDIYFVGVDPCSLDFTAAPRRLTDHPATDRYPDVFPPPLPPGDAWPYGKAGCAPFPASAAGAEPPPWPGRQDGLAFLWQAGDAPNLVFNPRLDAMAAYPVQARGRGRMDRQQAMALDGGSFVAVEEASQRLTEEARASRELGIQLTLTPAVARSPGFAPIVALADSPGALNFALGQRGDELVLRILTGPPGQQPAVKEARLLKLVAGRTDHVVVSYARGELELFRDGKPVRPLTANVGGAFARWQPRRLTFGDFLTPGQDTDWPGTLEGIALYTKVLAEGEALDDFRHYQQYREGRRAGEVTRVRVRARLAETSRIPTLREISPYRQALAVYAWEVLEAQGGSTPRPGETIRVAHWVLLDGDRQPITRLAPGAEARLELELYADNPQLEAHTLSDTLRGEKTGKLWFAAGE